MSVYRIQSPPLAHHGVLGMRWGIRRYQPYSVKPRGSGKKGEEIGEARKAEKLKKVAKTVGKVALQSALMGATVAAKVIFSSAITSATLVGIAAVGYQTLTSPEVSQLLNQLGMKAGSYIFDRYVRVGVNSVNQDVDYYLAQGQYYLKTLN